MTVNSPSESEEDDIFNVVILSSKTPKLSALTILVSESLIVMASSFE